MSCSEKEILELKEKVAQTVRILHKADVLTLTVGHVSCRIPGTDHFVVLGHAHKSGKTLSEITADDIITADLDGKLVEGAIEPPGEVYIHSEIYKTHPEVNSVIHAHAETSMIFGLANVPIVPVYMRAGQFYPEVPMWDFPGQIDTPELGAEVAERIGSNAALLLRGHGSVLTGTSLEDAGYNAMMLEKNAKLQWMAMQLGEVMPLNEKYVKAHKVSSVWNYYIRKYDA